MANTYIIATAKMSFDEMIAHMDRHDSQFITRQILSNEDDTTDYGFVISRKDNIPQLFAAMPSSQPQATVQTGKKVTIYFIFSFANCNLLNMLTNTKENPPWKTKGFSRSSLQTLLYNPRLGDSIFLSNSWPHNLG